MAGMTMRYRSSAALVLLALLLALLAIGAWWYGIAGPAGGGATVALPLAPGRALNVSVWLRDDRVAFWPDATGSARRSSHYVVTASSRFTVAIWYQDITSIRNTRLAVLKLPTWPLLLMSGGSAFAAARAWPRRGSKVAPMTTDH